MPDDLSHYGVVNNRLTPAAAMEQALSLFEAAGRAGRKAMNMTTPFNPPLENLRRAWFLYTWTTRERKELTPEFRDTMRNRIGAYRELVRLSPDGGIC
jgi:hypothetical protein